MASKRALALFALAAAAVVAFAAPPPALSASTGTLRICTGCAAAGGDLSRFGYVILHSWEYGRIPALRAANPGIKVLVYKNMSGSYEYAVRNGRDQTHLPAGIGHLWAREHRPDWFVRDTQGLAIEFADFPQVWLMDVGSPSYQEAWLANVAFELKSFGWDGVMIDDANVSPRYHSGGRTIARYPADADWTAATRSFLARVGPALQAQGRLVLPNMATVWPSGPAVWRDWLQFTSGAVLEYWSKWGHGTTQHFAERDWAYRQQFLPITQGARKIFLGITYAPRGDARSMRYARASFLLDWDGGAGALIFEPHGAEAQQPYSPEWTIDVGRPLGPRQAVGSVWKRNYTQGVVLANISDGSSQRVKLGRTYVTAAGERVTAVTLGPKTGLVLRVPGRILSTHTRVGAVSATHHDATRLVERLRTKNRRVTRFRRA